MEVSTADLAEILNVTERRIQQLATSGVLRRQDHGTWILPESVQAFLAYRLRSAAGKTKAKSGTVDEQIKLVKLRREQMRLAADERELVPVAEALAAASEVAGAVAFRMNAVAPAFTRDLAEQERLQKIIDDGLRSVADRLEELGASLRGGGEDPAPDDEDDA